MAKEIIILVFFTVFVANAHGYYFKRSKETICPPKPDYSKCLFNAPCDPSKPNPCGCPHACCAQAKSFYIASKSSDGSMKSVLHKNNISPTYFCFKKGECNQRCGRIWKFFNNIDKCGCGAGLKCSEGAWFFDSKCKPVN